MCAAAPMAHDPEQVGVKCRDLLGFHNLDYVDGKRIHTDGFQISDCGLDWQCALFFLFFFFLCENELCIFGSASK